MAGSMRLIWRRMTARRSGATLMFRKKKIIWWETEPIVAGAEQARARGSLEDSGRCRATTSPFYGPVTVMMESDEAGGAESLDLAKS